MVTEHPSAPSASEAAKHHSELDEFERQNGRPPFILTYAEVKLLGIAGVGFFLDAYDIFIINPVATLLQYRLYGGGSLPSRLEGFMKAGVTIGNVIGQFAFGYAADALGRKAIYGKELILVIIATVLTMTTPTGSLSPDHSLIYLGIFRILVGIGVGGDYPMAASIVSDRASLRKRGTLLAYIISNQGWGSFCGSLVTIIVLAAYRSVMEGKGQISKADGVWRIVVGVSLVPAFGTLYQRLTLPESARFITSQKLRGEEADADAAIEEFKKAQVGQRKLYSNTPKEDEKKEDGIREGENRSDAHKEGFSEDNFAPEVLVKRKAHFREFIQYFSEWRHAKLLIGTCVPWFLVDISFYGINLNQNFVLQQIGFDGKTGTPWRRLFNISTGNMIITTLGFVPGYYATVLTIEKLGRKPIQIMGFLVTSVFLGILAGLFHTLSKPAFIVCFTFLQFFFNFGANLRVPFIHVT